MKALFLSILALLPAAASAQRDTLGVLAVSYTHLTLPTTSRV